MIKKIVFILSIIGLFIISIQSSFALQTYVGVKILNISDDPASSCVDVAGYGSQGRIRALSSIQGSYPIWFNLSYLGNGTTIWSGNDTQDLDYTINDVILLPVQVDLEIGQQYKLFFDVDAIRIYLPLANSGGFTETADDNYWTIGSLGSGGVAEFSARSNSGVCTYQSMSATSYTQANMIFFSNSRDVSKLSNSCMTDGVTNCGALGIVGTDYNLNTLLSYKIGTYYNNLHSSTVGNFQFSFTFS